MYSNRTNDLSIFITTLVGIYFYLFTDCYTTLMDASLRWQRPKRRGACIAVNHKFIVLSGKVRGTGAYNWWIHCLVSQFWWPQEKKLQILCLMPDPVTFIPCLHINSKANESSHHVNQGPLFCPVKRPSNPLLWKFQGHTRDNLRCRFPTRNMYVLLRFMVGYIIVLYIYIIYIYIYIHHIYIYNIYIYIHAIFLRI